MTKEVSDGKRGNKRPRFNCLYIVKCDGVKPAVDAPMQNLTTFSASGCESVHDAGRARPIWRVASVIAFQDRCQIEPS